MKDEKGYVLLVVLFLVAIIMVISTAFVSASVSNAKQGKMVDENNLAVVAAEMGVDYYKAAILNEFNKQKGTLISDAQAEVDTFIYSNGYKNMNEPERTTALANELIEIRKRLGPKLEGVLNAAISDVNDFPRSDIREGLKFEGKKIFAEYKRPGVMEVIVKGEIHAKNDKGDNKDRILKFDMTFEVPELKMVEGSSEGGEVIDFNRLYPNPIGLPKCIGDLTGKECMGDNSTSLKNLNKTKIYFPDGYSNKNDNKIDFKNSKMYVKSNDPNVPAIAVKNMNNLENATLFIRGAFQIGDKPKSGSFNGMSNSNIIQYGAMVVNSNMQNMSKSTIKIKGSFTVNGQMNGISDSKICVDGSFTVNGLMQNASSGSKIYVKGAIHAPNAPAGLIEKVSTEAELWAKCGGDGSSSTNVNINWGIPDIDVKY